MSGIDPTAARRAMGVINHPWEAEGITDVIDRSMVNKLQGKLSDLYSCYFLLFNYDLKREGDKFRVLSKAELCVRSKKSSMSLGLISKAEIVDGYLDLYITDSEGNELVIKMKIEV